MSCCDGFLVLLAVLPSFEFKWEEEVPQILPVGAFWLQAQREPGSGWEG